MTGEKIEIPTQDGPLTGQWFGAPAENRPTSAPAIVMLHEGLGSISMWGDFPQYLAEQTRVPVLAYERQGHGKKARPSLPRPKEWMHHEALSILPDVLQDQGITRPFLFSHSDGATIALIHAAHHAVRGVVSEAAHVFQDEMMLQGQRKATGQWAHGVLRRFLTEHHGADAEMLLTGWLDWWRQARSRDWNILRELSGVACPVLAVQGDLDAYGTPQQIEHICERVSGPSEAVMIEGCGHIPHQDAREKLMGRLLPWIQEHKVFD